MIIACRKLNKCFSSNQGTTNVLKNVSFEVNRGEIFCIVGPSGCGKTTLLRILCGLDKPDSGEYVYVPSKGGDNSFRAMVFQEHALYPWKTVIDNFGFSLGKKWRTSHSNRTRINDLLLTMGLEEFAGYYPHQLSIGMCQRVNLARAFAGNAELLLMDEPFSALDMQSRLLLQEELIRIWENSGKTIIFVTHDILEAVRLADRILVLGARPGSVKDILTVDRPRSRCDEAVFFPERHMLMQQIWDMLETDVRASTGGSGHISGFNPG